MGPTAGFIFDHQTATNVHGVSQSYVEKEKRRIEVDRGQSSGHLAQHDAGKGFKQLYGNSLSSIG